MEFNNIFEDDHSEAEDILEILPGIKLQKWQLAKLKEHFALESESVKVE